VDHCLGAMIRLASANKYVPVISLSRSAFPNQKEEPLMRVVPPGSGVGPGSLPHRDDLFTNRDNESRSFSAALTAFRRLLDKEDDAGTARCNIFVFYGVGGIGKTALSTRLEAWIQGGLLDDDPWGPRRPPTSPRLYALTCMGLLDRWI
jgi:hypothetical protein